MNEKKVPEVRFRGFSGEWEKKSLLSIAEFNPKAEIPDKFEYVDLESVVGTQLVESRKVNKETAPSRAQRVALQGDVFYQTVRPYQKNNYMFDMPYNHYVFSTGYTQMRPFGDSYCLLSFLQNDKFVKKVLDDCTGTSYPAINSTSLSNIVISYMRDANEQTKIGEFFKNLDNLIAQNQKKYDKLVNMKKACLDKMFPKDGADTPEVRFKGFRGEWERIKLSDVADIVGGGTPSTQIPDYWNGEIEWYSPTEIGESVYADHSQKTITKLGFEKCSAKMLPANTTVLFTSRAGIGDMAILRHAATTNQGFQSFVMKNGNNTYFLYSSGCYIKSYALKNASGSTFLEISGKQLGKMDYTVPNKTEQTKIGTFFQTLDNLINLQKTKLEKLKNIKKACLDKMFI